MKGKIIVGSFIALVISVVVVWAVPNRECPDGMTEGTFVNGAGKVIELCVPNHVAEAGNIGGPNDIFIPATCPCFSQEEVEATLNDNPDIVCEQWDGTSVVNGESCTYVDCFYFKSFESPEEENCDFGEPTPPLRICPGNLCYNYNSGYMCGQLSPEQADACVAILKTFVTPAVGECSDNGDCLPNEYCQKSVGDCSGAGTCAEKPFPCTTVWMPVCGCDENTYENACAAAYLGVNVATEGECL